MFLIVMNIKNRIILYDYVKKSDPYSLVILHHIYINCISVNLSDISKGLKSKIEPPFVRVNAFKLAYFLSILSSKAKPMNHS